MDQRFEHSFPEPENYALLLDYVLEQLSHFEEYTNSRCSECNLPINFLGNELRTKLIEDIKERTGRHVFWGNTFGNSKYLRIYISVSNNESIEFFSKEEQKTMDAHAKIFG